MSAKRPNDLPGTIAARERRKLRARATRHHTVWFGLGMFGLIGWSVSVPTVLGTLLGVWIDHRWPSDVSWTLTFLILGVVVGCANAWRWIEREGQLRERTAEPERDADERRERT